MFTSREDIKKAMEIEEAKLLDFCVIKRDAAMIEFLLENAEIQLGENDKFYLGKLLLCTAEHIRYGRERKACGKIKENNEAAVKYESGADARCYDGYFDFGHVAPDFEAVLDLGIPGLRARAAEYAKKHEGRAERAEFFEAVDAAYSSAEKFLFRASEGANRIGNTELASVLKNLACRAPETLYEAMQLVFVMYMLIYGAEATAVRSFGRLDSLLQSFYDHDIKSGILDDRAAAELVCEFIKAMDSYKISANIPFAIGGNRGGKSLVCPMSYILLKSYISLKPPYTKIHFLYDGNTPKELTQLAFDGIRNGANSIVFLCDRTVQKSLLHIGADAADVEDYSVVGCYECGAKDEVTCSCSGKLNLAKVLEVVLFGGKELKTGAAVGNENERCDFKSFDELMQAFYDQLEYFCHATIEIVNCYESYYPFIHSSPIFSSTYISSLENGGDIYCNNSAKYTNSSINAVGLATAVDSLAAIRKLVFEDKIMSMAELRAVLKADWQGREDLRLLIKNKYPKYGMGDNDTDSISRDIFKALDSFITGKSNVKGGVYRLGTFSIDWRVDYGKYTGASANGRKAGEMLSLNTGASIGGDRLGVTAHIMSVSGCDGSLTPNGSVLDLDLHSSAVQGDAGLRAMMSTLETYEKLGGFAVHYNVLDTAVLKDARQNPEKYPNLQVRLCGWNALFTSLDSAAQEDFIKRAENKE